MFGQFGHRPTPAPGRTNPPPPPLSPARPPPPPAPAQENAANHWNPAVHGLTLNVRKMFQVRAAGGGS